MANGDDDHPSGVLQKLPREQLLDIIEGLRQGVATEILPPPRGRSYQTTGVEAVIVDRVKNELRREIVDDMRSELDRMKADIVKECRDLVRESTRTFLPDVEIQKRIDEKVETTFDDIGLPIDREHKRETIESVRSFVRWQKRIDKVLGGMALAVVTAVLYALAKLVGINLPVPGNEH